MKSLRVSACFVSRMAARAPILGCFRACSHTLATRIIRNRSNVTFRGNIAIQKRPMVIVTQTQASDPTAPPERPVVSHQTNSESEERSSDAPLTITDACYKRIQQLSEQRSASLDTMYLRVFVDAGGCSGFSYNFELDSDENLEDDDVVFADDNSLARLVVDEGSLDIMKGATVDFVQEMIKSSFEVRDNPQSESACGCGSSFAVKNFAANPALD